MRFCFDYNFQSDVTFYLHICKTFKPFLLRAVWKEEKTGEWEDKIAISWLDAQGAACADTPAGLVSWPGQVGAPAGQARGCAAGSSLAQGFIPVLSQARSKVGFQMSGSSYEVE